MTMTMTTTTHESWRWLTPAAALAHIHALARAERWLLVTDESHGLYNPRKLEWTGEGGLRVGWIEYHEHGLRGISLAAEDADVRARVSGLLDAGFAVWTDEALRRDAYCDDLPERLTAVRTWVVLSVYQPERAHGRIEAITALARHEHPVARVAGLDLAFMLIRSDAEAIGALARERVGRDLELGESWQRLLDALAA
jgi:hypothetical protein